MNPVNIACAHEFAHCPPPTAEDYQRLDKALNTIFNKGNNEMTEQTAAIQEPTITVEQLEEMAETTSFAASELLKQDGWAILTEMQKALLQGINSTGLVVLPVEANREEVMGKVSDPEGLTKILDTLRKDIIAIIESVRILSLKHVGKTGEPDQGDLVVIDAISAGYSTLQGHLERAINPLVLQIADILEAANITSLEIK